MLKCFWPHPYTNSDVIASVLIVTFLTHKSTLFSSCQKQNTYFGITDGGRGQLKTCLTDPTESSVELTRPLDIIPGEMTRSSSQRTTPNLEPDHWFVPEGVRLPFVCCTADTHP